MYYPDSAENDSKCQSTGFTPFELDTGAAPANHLDFFTDLIRSASSFNPTASKFVEDLQHDLAAARTALEAAQVQQRKQAQEAKRKPSNITFATGDWVLLDSTHFFERHLQPKLQPRYLGPFLVTQVFYDDEFYRLQKSKTWGISKVQPRRKVAQQAANKAR